MFGFKIGCNNMYNGCVSFGIGFQQLNHACILLDLDRIQVQCKRFKIAVFAAALKAYNKQDGND